MQTQLPERGVGLVSEILPLRRHQSQKIVVRSKNSVKVRRFGKILGGESEWVYSGIRAMIRGSISLVSHAGSLGQRLVLILIWVEVLVQIGVRDLSGIEGLIEWSLLGAEGGHLREIDFLDAAWIRHGPHDVSCSVELVERDRTQFDHHFREFVIGLNHEEFNFLRQRERFAVVHDRFVFA
ncbi:MAG: hypothetical protein ACI814_000243 [Mariniblastus sp.]|jgi:hypothetical protein